MNGKLFLSCWRMPLAVLALSAALFETRAATHQVTIVNSTFSPAQLTIQKGDTVTWVQMDFVEHTTTSGVNGVPNGIWDSGTMTRNFNTTFSHTFNTAGSFPYYCEPHLFMVGTITVAEPAPVPPTVSITSPSSGVTIEAGASLTVQVAASDSDGTVTEVRLLRDGETLGIAAAAPYEFTVQLGVGTHVLSARATDNSGASTVSASVTVTVNPPPPPEEIVLTSVSVEAAGARLEWTGGAGPFAIQRTESLANPVWVNVAVSAGRGAVAASLTGGFFRIRDLAGGGTVAFTAALNGQNERPTPNAATGSGMAHFALDGDTLTFNIRYADLTGAATGAHIHAPAPASAAAGVVLDLSSFNGGAFGMAGHLTGTTTLTAQQRDHVLSGKAYVNIHTAAHPGGEIRGQIAPVVFAARLSGQAERPAPVQTAGHGTGVFVLVGSRLTFDIAYDGLSGAATSAHIHGPAATTVPAGVLEDLQPFHGGAFGVSGSMSGSVELSADKVAALVDELTYVNIHTAANSGGEIRGQILPQSTAAAFTALLSGEAERPNPVTTSGAGTGTFSLEGNTLTFAVRYSGLSGPATAAHIHGSATTAVAAGVLIDLRPFNGGAFGASGTLAGRVVLSDAHKALVLAGRTYVNIHTAAHTAGEIRGQVVPVLFQATVNGAAERPNPLDVPGAGRGILLLVRERLSVSVAYHALTGIATGAHIHGPADESANAGIIIDLSATNGGAFGASGLLSGSIATVSEVHRSRIVDGLTYVNFHTALNGGGEIRGQIKP